MATPLRALIVESSEDDASLVVREIERAGYDVASRRVDTPETVTAALDDGQWDVVIANHQMPGLRGIDALKLVRHKGLDTPLVFVSADAEEDVAVEAMRAGADDYVTKDQLARLPAVIRRELRKTEARRQRWRAKEALCEREAELAAIYQHFPAAVMIVDEERHVLEVNELASAFAGRPRWEMIGRRGGEAMGCLHSLDDPRGCGFGEFCQTCPVRNTVLDTFKTRTAHLNVEATLPFLRGDETRETHLLVSAVPLGIDAKTRVLVAMQDVTELWEAREEVKRQKDFLDTVMNSLDHPFFVLNAEDYAIQFANAAARRAADGDVSTCYALSHHRDEPCRSAEHPCLLEEVRRTRGPVVVEHLHRYEGGQMRPVEVHGFPILGDDGNVSQVIEYSVDITERKKAEDEIRSSQERWQSTFDGMSDWVALLDPEGRIVQSNAAVEEVLGIPRDKAVSRICCEVVHGSSHRVPGCPFARMLETRCRESVELEVPDSDRWLLVTADPVKDADGRVVAAVHVVRDISRRKQDEARRMIESRILGILNQSINEVGVIRQILLLVKAFSGMEAAGIRLLDGEDFPYYETLGFPAAFVEAERYVCARDQKGELIRDSEGSPVLECMCGNIICGRFDPSLPFFTEGGSFWTNGTTELLASSSEEDRQARTRNRCNGEGYESVGLFPLRAGNANIGLLQLNDRRKDMFTPESVALYEGIAASIGVAMARKRAEESLEVRTHDLGERNKELSCLYAVSRRLVDLGKPMDEALQSAVELIPSGWQYPETACARISIEGRHLTTESFRESAWKLAADIRVSGEKVGAVEVFYPEDRAELDDGPFTGEERELIDALARETGRFVERKRAEEMVRKGRDRAQMLLDVAGTMTLALDAEGKVTLVNRKGCEILGCEECEILGKDWFSNFLPEDLREEVRGVFDKLMRGEMEGVDYYENQVLTATGELRDVGWHNVFLRDDGGRVIGTLGSGVDVTERKRAEEKVVTLAKLPGENPSPVLRVRRDGTIVYANDASAPLLGEWASGIDGAVPEDIRHHVARTHESGRSQVIDVCVGDRTYSFVIAPVPGEDYVNFYGRDVTEHRALENQLRHAQKMEAVGFLAGGVAHDFNNLLMAILGRANLLKMAAKPGSDVFEGTEIIETASLQAAELARQLLAFARRAEQKHVPVDVHGIVGEVVAVLGRTIDKSIVVSQRPDALASIVDGDPSQLQQVVMNLAVNARDAMPDGGKMIFGTRVAELDQDYCRAHPNTSTGRFLVLSVTDTGAGIPLEVRDRIFEPFFTTKEQGKGTGMGLAMVYGIVKNHGGIVEVQSDPARGTTFTVYLPLAEEVGPPEEQAGEEEPIRGTGRILVVDDEETVRLTIEQMLRSIGYEVTCVSDGRQAVDYYTEHGKEIDLVLLDMTMPVMNGRQCFRELKKTDPGVRALLSTGHAFDEVAQSLLEQGMLGYVQKPYVVTELSKTVAKALQSGSGATGRPEQRKPLVSPEELRGALHDAIGDLRRSAAALEAAGAQSLSEDIGVLAGRLSQFEQASTQNRAASSDRHQISNLLAATELKAKLLASDPATGQEARSAAEAVIDTIRRVTNSVKRLGDGIGRES